MLILILGLALMILILIIVLVALLNKQKIVIVFEAKIPFIGIKLNIDKGQAQQKINN